MKIYIAIFLLASIVIAGCKKDKNKDGNLVGTWELRHVYGGQVPGGPSDFEPGNGKIIQISKTNFKDISGGKVISDRKYTIIKKETVVNSDKVFYQIIFDTEGLTINPYFRITDSGELKLYLGSIASDGIEAIYARQ